MLYAIYVFLLTSQDIVIPCTLSVVHNNTSTYIYLKTVEFDRLDVIDCPSNLTRLWFFLPFSADDGPLSVQFSPQVCHAVKNKGVEDAIALSYFVQNPESPSPESHACLLLI